MTWNALKGVECAGGRGGLGRLACGEYTDDTEATLALAESIVLMNGVQREHATLNWVRWWSEAPERHGYSSGTFRKLKGYLETKQRIPEEPRTRSERPCNHWTASMKISKIIYI